MASYIVLEPTDVVQLKPAFSASAGRNGAGDHTVFVRDEFTVFALILPFFWLLAHRLWWQALMIALISWGLANILGAYISSALALSVLSLLLSVFVALEGRNWYLAKLRRKGYEEVALINADSLYDAEILYFYGAAHVVDRTDPEGGVATGAGSTVSIPAPEGGNPAAADMIGLVEYRGRS
ncbi:DUF2628 domain-containing protein [Pseudochrobactrum sp. HB0163]|uniref:DUF2628 domain-containing protein n=1 Tax=Pseudochrobactrum sp. HB0163 TaxID=3450708 RepID=UPI003F6E0D77